VLAALILLRVDVRKQLVGWQVTEQREGTAMIPSIWKGEPL
jgi:hypothetical protein